MKKCVVIKLHQHINIRKIVLMLVTKLKAIQ